MAREVLLVAATAMLWGGSELTVVNPEFEKRCLDVFAVGSDNFTPFSHERAGVESLLWAEKNLGNSGKDIDFDPEIRGTVPSVFSFSPDESYASVLELGNPGRSADAVDSEAVVRAFFLESPAFGVLLRANEGYPAQRAEALVALPMRSGAEGHGGKEREANAPAPAADPGLAGRV